MTKISLTAIFVSICVFIFLLGTIMSIKIHIFPNSFFFSQINIFPHTSWQLHKYPLWYPCMGITKVREKQRSYTSVHHHHNHHNHILTLIYDTLPQILNKTEMQMMCGISHRALLTFSYVRKEPEWNQCAVLPSFIARCKQMLYSSCAEKLFLSVTQQP